MKIAIEAKLKKQAVYAPRSDTTYLSTSKLRNDSSLGKSQKKILPPLRTAQSPTSQDNLFNSSNNKSLRLDTLSPVMARPTLPKRLPKTTTSKESKFFVTSELTPHYITTDAASNMEPSMIDKVSS